jgi:hypothetical protein
MMRPFMSSLGSCTTETVGGVAGGEALHGHREDRAHAPLGVALGLLLDDAQDLDRVVARLVLDLLEQRLLGLARAEAGGALEGALVLVAQVGELLLLGREPLDVRLEVALARVELGRPAIEGVLERPGPFGGPRVRRRSLAMSEVGRGRGLGVPAAVGGGEPPAPVQRGSRDEADCQNGRRDHDFHCLSSPREPGWRPAQTVFFRGSWGGRPAAGGGTRTKVACGRAGRASGALEVCGVDGCRRAGSPG